MARRVPAPVVQEEAPPAPVAANPANPELFEEDLEALAWEALGVGLASLINDRMIAPLARQVMPSTLGPESKLLDALTTAATGWGAGEVIGMASPRVASRIRRGGVLLGVARGLSAFIPGYGLTATFPAVPWIPNLSTPVVPLPAPAKNGNGTIVNLPVVSMASGTDAI